MIRFRLALAVLLALLFSVKQGSAQSLNDSCRAFGVNYFDVFNKSLDRKALVGDRDFEELVSYGIPFARFSASPYWPSEWNLYFSNRAGYFRYLDAVFAAAKRSKIGLIPSLFWNYAAVPDLVNEPASAWGDRNSKTIQFMREYTAQVVSRYKDMGVVWAWEFGNEMNLYASLPNGGDFLPKTAVEKGTPVRRSDRDRVSVSDLGIAIEEFERVVRSIDPDAPVSTGGALPRPSAFHNWKSGLWVPDSQAQFAEILVRQNPQSNGWVSVHLYPEDANRFPWAHGSYLKLLEGVVSAGQAKGMRTLVGEFGVKGSDAVARAEFERMVLDIERSRVSLAALWVYRFDWQRDSFDVRGSGIRSYQLERLKVVNDGFDDKGLLCRVP